MVFHRRLPSHLYYTLGVTSQVQIRVKLTFIPTVARKHFLNRAVSLVLHKDPVSQGSRLYLKQSSHTCSTHAFPVVEAVTATTNRKLSSCSDSPADCPYLSDYYHWFRQLTEFPLKVALVRGGTDSLAGVPRIQVVSQLTHSTQNLLGESLGGIAFSAHLSSA